MQVLYYPDNPSPAWRDPVTALGNFDGMHRGHMRLLERVRRQAGERGGTPVAMIFDPHPPRSAAGQGAAALDDARAEARGLRRAGMQGVAIVRFSHDVSR
jgi:riboflavin kinase/FMN adenylyltransferase